LQDPGPNCKNLSRWEDRHAKTKLPRVSLTKSSKLHRGSWIQRLPARACAVERAVVAVHESTVDRPLTRKGTRSCPSIADITAQVACKRGATASTPECGGAWWRVHRHGPISLHKTPIRARAGSTRSWEARERA
jgi:hypothetical protein